MTMTDARNLLDQWIEFVNNLDVENLLNLYDSTAILLPTFSNRIRNTPQELREYFEELGSREDLKVTLQEETLAIQQLQEHIYSLSGLYDWSFKVDGELQNFEARYSYFVDLSNANPILHHHSSQNPS
ncbi:MAG: DUF4440 domain-containing protein [Thermodesulfobacteriota bacterium]